MVFPTPERGPSGPSVRPHAPAEQVGTAEEIAVVRKLLRHAGSLLTVSDFVRGVAKLGGFLGCKGDGAPGGRALWRGYQHLQDMVFAVHRLASAAEDSG